MTTEIPVRAQYSSIRSVAWYFGMAALSVAVALPVFVRLTAPAAQTDILHHAELAKRIIEHGGWISYSLWYPLVYIFSLGAQSLHTMRIASVGLLTIVIVVKCLLVYWTALRAGLSRPIALGTSFCLMVVMPILDPTRPKNIYLGQISPNVWHNSTNIFAEPFAIAAVLAAFTLLRSLSVRNAMIFSALIVVAALAKPNYPIAFLPVVGIATIVVLWRVRPKRIVALLILVISYLPVMAVLIYQYAIVYTGKPIITTTKISIDPFAVWRVFSPNIPLSIVLSLAGPVLVLIALKPSQRRSLPIVLSWSALVVAIAQAAILGEQNRAGHLVTDGNWFWGAYTALLIVFLVSLIEFVKLIRCSSLTADRLLIVSIAGLALAAHIATGVYYVLNIGVGDYPSY